MFHNLKNKTSLSLPSLVEVGRNVASFLGLALALFIIPITMLNTHPAVREVSRRVPATEGVIQFVVQTNANDQIIVQSAEVLSDISLLTPMNATFSHLSSNKKTAPSFWSLNTVSQPIDEFTIERHLQQENLLHSSNIIVHVFNLESRLFWEQLSTNPQIEPLGCTAPNLLTFSRWDICQAQFDQNLIRINTVGVFGWSAPESWGIWTIDTDPRALFYADIDSDYQLEVEWFPNCVEGKFQSAKVSINQTEVGDFSWEDCETKTAFFDIPQEALNTRLDQTALDRNLIFENELAFEFAYEGDDSGNSSDPRDLAVGFNKILITKKPN